MPAKWIKSALGALAILAGSISVTASAQDYADDFVLRLRQPTPAYPGPPAGMTALETDLFTSKNFYKDRALWSDPRYYRCNTPREITDLYRSGRFGKSPPTSAAWGDCKKDYARSNLVSPYPYRTAQEHYNALLAAAKAKGGPTVYTKATLPDWDGRYKRDYPVDANAGWLGGTMTQVPTILSLLTPEYQKRMVQGEYHESVDASSQWNATFCYPDGFMRWWAPTAAGGHFQLLMNPYVVQTLSGLPGNFLRQFNIGQQSFILPVKQWTGESVAFWDGTTLVAWTGNVQPWTLTHGLFEFSDQIQTVETFKPVLDENGKFIGLDQDTVFYDPVAFVQPLHILDRYYRRVMPDTPQMRYSYNECLGNIRNRNGRPVQLTKGDPDYVDHFNRPWAKNWEHWFEQGWDKPADSGDTPKDVLDIFK